MQIRNNADIPEGKEMEDFLDNKSYTFGLKKMCPFNIAKRILVSFCSVEHPGLTDAIPEIRKAILDETYKPNLTDFSLYLCLHLGRSAFFGTIATLSDFGKGNVIHAFAGIESEMIAFYLVRHDRGRSNGLDKCLDITHWLSDFDYNQEVEMQFILPFHKSFMVRFPIDD